MLRTDHEATALQHQIEHTDGEIDALVYELYGLTDQEVALVEMATSNPIIGSPSTRPNS